MLAKVETFVEQAGYVLAAALVAMMFVGPRLFAQDTGSQRGTPAAAGFGDSKPGEGPQRIDAAAGKKVFVENCGTCHRLADAGTTGTTGPALDGKKLDIREVIPTVLQGKGDMPGFEGKLDRRDAAAVAVYVVQQSQ